VRSRLTAREASERLGVKLDTIYAYVSRGILKRYPGPDGRASLFDVAEIERLARVSRRSSAGQSEQLTVTSALTLIRDDTFFYRGRNAIDLAFSSSFEAVAELLWSGDLPSDPPRWHAQPDLLAAARTAQAALPAGTMPADRLPVSVATLAAADHPSRPHRDRFDAHDAARLVANLVHSLAPAGRRLRPQASMAATLLTSLSATPPGADDTELVEAVLILSADHELAPNTVAARLAAGWGDPYLVLLAGFGAIGRPSVAVERLLVQVAAEGNPARVIGRRLGAGERLPGFGHLVHRHGDPRAAPILSRLTQTISGPRTDLVAAVIQTGVDRSLPPPNLDLAVAAVSYVLNLVPGAGEGLITAGRTAGWLAHALEESEEPTVFRPRAIYRGPEPSPR
jgi:citrate synthase